MVEVRGEPAWRIQTFGGLRVTGPNGPVSFRTHKTAGVFAHLAYYANRSVSKEMLMEAFWPNTPQEKARQSLRTAVSAIRIEIEKAGSVPANWIHSTHRALEIGSDCFEVDTARFRQLLTLSRNQDADTKVKTLTAACELYLGPFLPEFSEEWVIPQTLELEEQYVQAVSELSPLLSAIGNPGQAIEVATRAVTLCPGREEAHIALMKAFAAAGRATSAIAQFELMEKMLDEEWGESPSSEALAVLDNLPRAQSQNRHTTGDSQKDEEDLQLTAVAERVPATTGGFYGRSLDVDDVCRALRPESSATRCLTLTGLGGSGKTRLAQAVALALDEPFRGRVWFVPLAGVASPDHVADAVLGQVNPDLVVGPEPMADLSKSLNGAPSFIVLDNLESVFPSVKTIIELMLRACPELTILSTSRWPIGSDLEVVRPVGPLELPKDYHDLPAMRSNPCVQLFVERGNSVRPGFQVSAINARGVYELCCRLGGMPLALELAASKLATRSPVQILSMISETLDLSTDDLRVEERHRSLRTVVKWNCDQLDYDCLRSFVKLSVCQGGWESDLAEAVLGQSAESHVPSLIGASLVYWSESEESVRFDMLESVREYALELRKAEPELSKEAVIDHAQFFTELCAERPRGQKSQDWLKRLGREQGNLLAVINAGAQSLIPSESAWTVCEAVIELVNWRGRSAVWVESMAQLLDTTGESLPLPRLVEAELAVAKMYYGLRDIAETYNHAARALEAADISGNKSLQIRARVGMAVPSSLIGKFDEAKADLADALSLLDEGASPSERFGIELNLAWLYFDGGDEPGSLPGFQRALALAESYGEPADIVSALVGLAVAVGETQPGEAAELFDRAKELADSRGRRQEAAHCLYYRAMTEHRAGLKDESLIHVLQAMSLFVEHGIRLGQTILTIAGCSLASAGRYEEAAICWGRAEASRKRHGMKMFPTQAKDYEREVVKVKQALGPMAFGTASAWGAETSDEDLTQRLFNA